MSSNGWKAHKLAEIVDDIAMGPFGSNIKVDNFIDQGVPVIRGSNLHEGGFDDEKFVFISEEKALSLKRSLAFPDDLVFTHRGTIGQVGIIPQGKYPKYLVSQSQMKLTVNKNYLSPKFLYYFFKSPIGQYELLKNTSQVGVPAIASPTSSLKEIDISIPNVKSQQRIASILSALDDKIVLNRQTNQTLEAIAQTLFKEWFINFNFPGATGEMQDSELGPIPKGWRVGRLGEVCEFAYGKALKAETRIKGDFVVVGSSGIVDTHNEFLVEGPGIVIGRKGTIGEVTWLHQNFFPIDTTFYINDLLGVNGLYFHYFLLKEQDFKKIGSDSAVPGLNRNQAYDNLISIPQLKFISQFNNISNSIFDMIYINEQQTQTLTQIRDGLLPKLMNGEIEV